MRQRRLSSREAAIVAGVIALIGILGVSFAVVRSSAHSNDQAGSEDPWIRQTRRATEALEDARARHAEALADHANNQRSFAELRERQRAIERRVVLELSRGLQSEDRFIRRSSARQLADMLAPNRSLDMSPAHDAIVRSLQDEDADVRHASILIVGLSEALIAQEWQVLVSIMEDAAEPVMTRSIAAQALSLAAARPRVKSALETQSRSTHMELRIHAAGSLAMRGLDPGVTVLLECLTDEKHCVAAVDALVRVGAAGTDALPKVYALLKSDSRVTRGTAAIVACAFGGATDQYGQVLVATAKARDVPTPLRLRAITCLGRLGALYRGILSELATDTSAPVRRAANEALEASGS